jgi:hypothetical protein
MDAAFISVEYSCKTDDVSSHNQSQIDMLQQACSCLITKLCCVVCCMHASLILMLCPTVAVYVAIYPYPNAGLSIGAAKTLIMRYEHCLLKSTLCWPFKIQLPLPYQHAIIACKKLSACRTVGHLPEVYFKCHHIKKSLLDAC